MKKTLCLTMVFVFLLSFMRVQAASGDAVLLKEAVMSMKNGQPSFALMKLERLAKTYPQSKYHELAAFGFGEIHYALEHFNLVQRYFDYFLTTFPKAQYRLLAQVYLMKIAELEGREADVERYRSEIVNDSQQVSFIFRDKKQEELFTPLKQKFVLVFYIDRIEVLKEGELFAKVHF